MCFRFFQITLFSFYQTCIEVASENNLIILQMNTIARSKTIRKGSLSKRSNQMSLMACYCIACLFCCAHAAAQCSPDLTTPSITCAKPDTFYVVQGECAISAALRLTLPAYSDNCTAASDLILSNNLSAPPYSIGATSFYWTVKDAQGNSGACATKIVVIDPTSTCPEVSGRSLTE